ncbi:hypothetical protein ACXR0O_28210 [Verrucomicrobiota bacterium sgz303538]
MKKLRKVMAGVLACGMILGFGVGVLLLLSRPDPVPPTIDFIEFRQTSGGTIAVFRATNPASQPFAYWGKSPSDPGVYYLIADRDRWETHLPLAFGPFSGIFTLSPNSSVDFVVPSPTAASIYKKPTSLGWGREVLHPTQSRPPQSANSFGIVLAFQRGDSASVLKGEHPLGNRIRTALWNQTSTLHAAGWIEKATYENVGRWLAAGEIPEVFWVESSPANPQGNE